MRRDLRDRSRFWPIRAIGLLLLFQAFGPMSVSIYKVATEYGLSRAAILQGLTPNQVEVFLFSVALAALALLSVLAAVGFFLLLPFGWILAISVQGLTLLLCLGFYFRNRPDFVYPIMLYSTVMVLYLNSFGVQKEFLNR